MKSQRPTHTIFHAIEVDDYLPLTRMTLSSYVCSDTRELIAETYDTKLYGDEETCANHRARFEEALAAGHATMYVYTRVASTIVIEWHRSAGQYHRPRFAYLGSTLEEIEISIKQLKLIGRRIERRRRGSGERVHEVSASTHRDPQEMLAAMRGMKDFVEVEPFGEHGYWVKKSPAKAQEAINLGA